MDHSLYFLLKKIFLDLVAFICPDHKEVPDMARCMGRVTGGRRQNYIRMFDIVNIILSYFTASMVICIKMREFYTKYGSLDLIKPGI